MKVNQLMVMVNEYSGVHEKQFVISNSNGFGLNELIELDKILANEKWLMKHKNSILTLQVDQVVVDRELEYTFDIVEKFDMGLLDRLLG